jgi:Radical SAM proteins, N-terminal
MNKYNTILKKVEKPARYTGGELNAVMKNPEKIKVHFAFAFPDLYEIGMSFTGMQIIYNILNQHEDFYCERAFAPAKDMENSCERVEFHYLASRQTPR